MSEMQQVWYQNLRGFIEGKFPATPEWRAIFLEQLALLYEGNERAILAERERCAKIAEKAPGDKEPSWDRDGWDHGYIQASRHIASTIRGTE